MQKATKAIATATATAKAGQASKVAAPVVQTRQYAKAMPAGMGCHGMYNAAGQLNQNGHIPAAQAMYATPRKLGLTPSVAIPSGAMQVLLLAAQPGMGTKYQTAYAAVAAGFKAAKLANGNKVTAAQVQACVPAWPAAKPKANSAWRHTVRTLGVAWAAS